MPGTLNPPDIEKLKRAGHAVWVDEGWNREVPFLVLPLCPPLNNLYPTRGKFRVKSKQYLAWEEMAEWFFMQQHWNLVPPHLSGLRWVLDMAVFMPNWASGDLDNRNKATIDFLCANRGLQDKYLMRLREVRVTDGKRLAGVVLAYDEWRKRE